MALGIEIDQRPFAKSTLQLFRAQLILHDQVRAVFQRSLEFARESGYLQGRKMKVVLDTTPILGRGAVKDTYNLPGGRDQEAGVGAGQEGGPYQARRCGHGSMGWGITTARA